MDEKPSFRRSKGTLTLVLCTVSVIALAIVVFYALGYAYDALSFIGSFIAAIFNFISGTIIELFKGIFSIWTLVIFCAFLLGTQGKFIDSLFWVIFIRFFLAIISQFGKV